MPFAPRPLKRNKPVLDFRSRLEQSRLAKQRQIAQARSGQARRTEIARPKRPVGLRVDRGQIAGRLLGQRVSQEIERKNPTVLSAVRRATAVTKGNPLNY